jgi:hypothetical protein
MSEHVPQLKMRTYEKFDGSVWRQYESQDAVIILTGMGRELMPRSGLAKVLGRYVCDLSAGREEPCNTRRYLASGGNARVFSVDDLPLVVKETTEGGDQLLPALERMDGLFHAIENHCPRWIDIPKHYGLLIPKADPLRQYLLMEKIDDGVSVGDIYRYGHTPREPHLEAAIQEHFGIVTPELNNEVMGRYKQIRRELHSALLAERLNPDNYMPDIDYNLDNVLVERRATPIAGSLIKFWVIDQ